MKKLLALASVAIVAMACNTNGTNNNAVQGDSTVVAAPASTDIVYVNMDSLMSGYTMYIEMSTKLQEKADKAEKDLNSRMRRFERNVADAREKIEKGLVTQATAIKLQEDLQREEQNLMNYQNKMQQELAEENSVMLNNLSHSMEQFLLEFNKDYKYAMIISTASGNPILHANPAFDITKEVMDGLNARYAKDNGGNKADTTSL